MMAALHPAKLKRKFLSAEMAKFKVIKNVMIKIQSVAMDAQIVILTLGSLVQDSLQAALNLFKTRIEV